MSISAEPANRSVSEEYSFERVSPLHYPLLIQLYADAFNAVPSLEEISHRFNTTSLGCELIGFIAIHTTTQLPAACYAVFPMEAIINGKIVQVAQSGDTMTHHMHRRKGLFVKLAKLTYKECIKSGIKILIGQPNENSFHGLVNKLGWTALDEVVRWDLKLKLKTIPLPKMARRFPVFQKQYFSYAHSILKKFIVTPDSFQNPLPLPYAKINRDNKYLTYKKSDDKFFLQIEDILIWVRLTDIFWIGDFEDYEKINPSFIKIIKRLAFRLGFNTISFCLNNSIPLPKALQPFKKNSAQASCFLYLDDQYRNINFVLTSADSDTW